MKSSDIKLSTEYLMLPTWLRHNKDDRDFNRVRRGQGVKATLQSMDKYKTAQFYDSNPSQFEKAEKGDRQIGYLVFCADLQRFFVARPQDIVGEYAVIEARWVVEEANRAVLEDEQRKAREAQQAKERIARESAQRDFDGIRLSLLKVLNGRVDESKLGLESYYYNNREFNPTVSIALTDFVRFVEKYHELTDQLS